LLKNKVKGEGYVVGLIQGFENSRNSRNSKIQRFKEIQKFKEIQTYINYK